MKNNPETPRQEVPHYRSELADMVANMDSAEKSYDNPIEQIDAVEDPYSALAKMMENVPAEHREAFGEHLMDAVIVPAGTLAVEGAGGSLDTGDEAEPTADVATVAPEVKHTTFVSEEDLPAEPHTAVDDAPGSTEIITPDGTVRVSTDPSARPDAPVIEIRPGASTEAPVVQPGTLEHRIETAKVLIDTAPSGKLSWSERRVLNATSRDMRTAERVALKNDDISRREVKKVIESRDKLSEAESAHENARYARMREVRRERVDRALREKVDQVREQLTVNGSLNHRAYKARMKTVEKQLKREIKNSTRTALKESKGSLARRAEELKAAEKAKARAIKSRRWYKNTRISGANRRGHSIKMAAREFKSLDRYRGGVYTPETDEEKRKRLARERARSVAA